MLLTTQHLDEAEQLADKIAILHQGRIIVDGTLGELRRVLPPATVEYVEKRPTLEDVSLAGLDFSTEQVRQRTALATKYDLFGRHHRMIHDRR